MPEQIANDPKMEGHAIVTLAECLEGDLHCALNHGGYKPPDTRAVQFIQQKFQNFATGEIDILQVPVCQECKETLESEEAMKIWILHYCYNCGHSQWIIRQLSKMVQPPVPILWLSKCKVCGTKYDSQKPI